MNGQRHREDGPAVEWADGMKSWYLNGEYLTEEEFNRKVHFVSYVAGLCFDNSKKIVALVKKNRPAWQKGKLNAIGGKIEKNETPLEAIRREFLEETGVEIQSWEETCSLTGKDWEFHFFHTFNDDVFNVRMMTDEAILLTEIVELDHTEIIPNLRVIIPLALDETGIVKPVNFVDRS
jgi:8-oxo-dGTP diphosphatase